MTGLFIARYNIYLGGKDTSRIVVNNWSNAVCVNIEYDYILARGSSGTVLAQTTTSTLQSGV